MINANNIGNKTVQQKDINWSNLILGNEALTHIKINTIIDVFIPKVRLLNNPSNEGLFKKLLILKYSAELVQFISNK